jgi:hypothetical protein
MEVPTVIGTRIKTFPTAPCFQKTMPDLPELSQIEEMLVTTVNILWKPTMYGVNNNIKAA